MNHLNLDEQDRVRKHPDDFSDRTRNDVEEQVQERLLAELRDTPLTAREEHVWAQEHPPKSMGVRAASQRLSRLVRRAQGGETIFITVDGKVSAQLCPVVPRIEAKEEV